MNISKTIGVTVLVALVLGVVATTAVSVQHVYALLRATGGVNPGGPMVPARGGYNGGNGIHITFGPCHEIAPGRYVC